MGLQGAQICPFDTYGKMSKHGDPFRLSSLKKLRKYGSNANLDGKKTLLMLGCHVLS